ncbi:MAG: hypothetical protein JXA11_10125 [Phycisphaerae bacterium]|nr:hypothetical protein [Phycisphaerae bacterium]
MYRKTWIWLCLLCAPSMVFISSMQADEIETITYSEEYSFTASDFNSQQYGYIGGMFLLPRFDTSMGHLQQVEFVMTLVSGSWSQIQIDSERADFGYGQHLTAGGWFLYSYPYIGEETAWTTVPYGGILHGKGAEFHELSIDTDDTPDFIGTDAASISGSLGMMSKSDGSTITPLPDFPGPDNENPAFIEYIQHPNEDPNITNTWFEVASSMCSPYYDDVVRTRTNGNVTIRGEVKYTYEVPEPVSLSLFGFIGTVLLRRRRGM